MLQKEYPYQVLSLGNIKGEKWKDIPGLEGYFMVSNYGRIKRLHYEQLYKNGCIYQKEEKIIKPSILKQPNHFKGDCVFFLTNRVMLDKKRYNFTIARLVYSCFVAKENATGKEGVIICRDKDNFNIRPSNLKRVNFSEKQRRIIELERFRSPFNDMSDKLREKQRKAIIKSVSKPVEQYSLTGKKIRNYKSMAAAQRATGIHSSAIGAIAAGKGKTAGGFIWKWKTTKE